MTIKRYYFLILLTGLLTAGRAQVSLENTTYDGWKLGLNAGWSYQSSDVRIDNGGFGLGLTLGRTLYRQPGAPLSFDLRGRLLYTQQYGLDFERNYNIENNTVLNGDRKLDYTSYPANLEEPRGFVYDNHRTHVAELGLEGVFTLNRLREKTGIIASLYGGVGLDWYQVLTDQAGVDRQHYFEEYAAIDEGAPRSTILNQLETSLDGSYETRADGFRREGKLGIMPSLGVELGYQLSPRLALLAGHRLTFSGTDLLDGQRWENGNNDLYHYTSFGLRFNLEPDRPRTIAAPEIDVRRPTPAPYTSQAPTVPVVADIRRVDNAADITFRLNGRDIPFEYRDGRLRSELPLQADRNVCIITATNPGGAARSEVLVFFRPAAVAPAPPPRPQSRRPVITFRRPDSYRTTAPEQRYTLEAVIDNVSSGRNVSLFLNGRSCDFRFDDRSGRLVAGLNLREGENEVRITAANRAGEAEGDVQITYRPERPAPTVRIVDPAYDATSPDASVRLVAETRGIDRREEVTVRLNGRIVYDFNFSVLNDRVTADLRLEEGWNDISVRVRNGNGEGEDRTRIRYDRQSPPYVRIERPLDGAEVGEARIDLRTGTAGIESPRQLNVYLNGRPVSNYRFDAGRQELTGTLSLSEGRNTIRVVGRNAAGSAEDQVTVTLVRTAAPTVRIDRPSDNSETKESRVEVRARLSEIASSRQVELYLNGRPVSNYRFDTGRQELTGTLSLSEGRNTIRVVGRNAAGSAEDQVTVTLVRTAAPTVRIDRPSDNSETKESRVEVRARLSEIASSRQVELYLNGRPVSNYRFDAGRQELTGTLSLSEGRNTIRVVGRNAAGSAEDQVTVTLVRTAAPTVRIDRPSDNSETKESRVEVRARLSEIASSRQVELYLNGRPVSNYRFDAGSQELTATLNLEEGRNTIRVVGRNEGGTAEDEATVKYVKPLDPPVVTFLTPSKPGTNAKTDRADIKVRISHVSSQKDIQVAVDGKSYDAFRFDARRGELSARISLRAGQTRVEVRAKNQAGSDQAATTINYRAPRGNAPRITIESLSRPVVDPMNPSAPRSTLVATIRYVDKQEAIELILNGKPVKGFSFNPKTGSLRYTFPLREGENVIIVRAANNHGSDEARRVIEG